LSCIIFAEKDERRRAVFEIARVLKSSGNAAVFDMWKTEEYEGGFREAGMLEVRMVAAGFLFLRICHTVTPGKPS
jgi:ubiquinone/menaquinone biosynthesis C-methylase UbiE